MSDIQSPCHRNEADEEEEKKERMIRDIASWL